MTRMMNAVLVTKSRRFECKFSTISISFSQKSHQNHTHRWRNKENSQIFFRSNCKVIPFLFFISSIHQTQQLTTTDNIKTTTSQQHQDNSRFSGTKNSKGKPQNSQQKNDACRVIKNLKLTHSFCRDLSLHQNQNNNNSDKQQRQPTTTTRFPADFSNNFKTLTSQKIPHQIHSTRGCISHHYSSHKGLVSTRLCLWHQIYPFTTPHHE